MPILLLNVKCGSEWECVLFCVLSGVYVCLFSTFASMLIFRAILFLELVHVLNFHYETWLTNFLSRTVQKRYERGSEINGMIRYFRAYVLTVVYLQCLTFLYLWFTENCSNFWMTDLPFNVLTAIYNLMRVDCLTSSEFMQNSRANIENLTCLKHG